MHANLFTLTTALLTFTGLTFASPLLSQLGEPSSAGLANTHLSDIDSSAVALLAERSKVAEFAPRLHVDASEKLQQVRNILEPELSFTD